MLSSTADYLYWMARYTERAENTARMLNVALEASLLPQPADVAENAWRATLDITELQSQFNQKHHTATQKAVIDFIVRDPDNPSSIVSCLRQARENARAVRGVLTTELWETKNTTWLMLQQHLQEGLLSRSPAQFLDWVKYRSHLARGVTLGTMLSDEPLYFIRLGTFLERADNTARILDMKFHSVPSSRVAQDATSSDAAPVDFYYWAALLRSVSGFEIYRKVYRDVIMPERVAELLILRADMPRSLVACMQEVLINLVHVRNSDSYKTERLIGKVHSELKYADINDILARGLHDYLDRFLEQTLQIGKGISRDFLMPPAE